MPLRVENGAHLEKLQIPLQLRGQVGSGKVEPVQACGCRLLLSLTVSQRTDGIPRITLQRLERMPQSNYV